MDFHDECTEKKALAGSRLAQQWLTCGIPQSMRADMQARLKRMEPEISRLVQLYDQLAAELAGDASVNGSVVLDESWCDAIGIPSEVDVRAAAVRLFASDHHTPTWLTRRSGYRSLVRGNSPASPPQLAKGDVPELRHVMPSNRSQGAELLAQYTRAAEICRELVDLCTAVKKRLGQMTDTATWDLLNERMRSDAGVGLDDVSAAALRLRVGFEDASSIDD